MTGLAKTFSIDLRSLALFRILLGLLVALDAAHKFLAARIFYTDWGLMPRTYWIEHYMVPGKFSVFLANGDLWFQRALIAILFASALSFAFGWRTKAANWVAFLLLCSLQSRNNLILSAADEVIRLSLFWSLFLPAGARFGLESDSKKPTSYFSIGTAALQLQLTYIYLFTAIFKLHPVWTQEFSAIYYALNIDMFAKPLASYLREYLGVMQALTGATLIFEFVGPLLALLPLPYLRIAMSLSFMAFHISLFLCMELGLFPWIMIALWMVYLPAAFWEIRFPKKLAAQMESAFARARKKIPSRHLLDWKLSSPTWFGQSVAAFFLFLITLLNLHTVNYVKAPLFLLQLTNVTYVNQTWDMFAPYPIRNDGWFVIEGKFQDGSTRDLMTGQAKTYEKPLHPADAYPGSEWRKFMLTVWDKANGKIILPFARYLCRQHSTSEGESSNLATISIEFVKEPTPPQGQPWPPTEVVKLWNHSCL